MGIEGLKSERQVVQFLGGEPVIYCPGCEQLHKIWVNAKNELTGAIWTWNCDQASPTFSPSINLTGQRCHFFVTAGQIHYCHDSNHALAGKVVPMVALDPQTLEPEGKAYE